MDPSRRQRRARVAYSTDPKPVVSIKNAIVNNPHAIDDAVNHDGLKTNKRQAVGDESAAMAIESLPAVSDSSTVMHMDEQYYVDEATVTNSVNDDDTSERPTIAAAKRLPPGYSKHTAGVVYKPWIREEDQEKLRFVKSLPPNEQVIELRGLFLERTEAAAYFRDKSVKQEEEIEEMYLDFDTRLKEVRHFWRDKIYKEHSRAGKLLKMSMQT